MAIAGEHHESVANFLELSQIDQHELNCGLYSAVSYEHDERLIQMLKDAGGDVNFEAHIESTAIGNKVFLIIFE